MRLPFSYWTTGTTRGEAETTCSVIQGHTGPTFAWHGLPLTHLGCRLTLCPGGTTDGSCLLSSNARLPHRARGGASIAIGKRMNDSGLPQACSLLLACRHHSVRKSSPWQTTRHAGSPQLVRASLSTSCRNVLVTLRCDSAIQLAGPYFQRKKIIPCGHQGSSHRIIHRALIPFMA